MIHCPECASESVIDLHITSHHGGGYTLQCAKCGYCGEVKPTLDEAQQDWQAADPDRADLRVAGTLLAEAASHVIREYDGLHRLAKATAAWYDALAHEGGRPWKDDA